MISVIAFARIRDHESFLRNVEVIDPDAVEQRLVFLQQDVNLLIGRNDYIFIRLCIETKRIVSVIAVIVAYLDADQKTLVLFFLQFEFQNFGCVARNFDVHSVVTSPEKLSFFLLIFIVKKASHEINKKSQAGGGKAVTIRGINHLLVSVSDLERSIRFYQEALGATLLVKGRSLAYFDLGGLWLALNTEPDIPRSEIRQSYTHLAFTVDEEDLPALEAKLAACGALLPGRERHSRDKSSLYFEDPDGHKFEFHTGTLRDRLDYYRAEKGHMQFFGDPPGD